MLDSGVIDDTSSRVVVDSDRDGRVVADDGTVAPDDGAARRSLQHHVIAVVASKVELVDWLDYTRTQQTSQLRHTSRQRRWPTLTAVSVGCRF